MSEFVSSAGERFGSVLRVRRAGDFLLRLSRYPPGLRMPAHHHPLAYFAYVVHGDVLERAGTSHARFDRGSLHFHSAGETHEGRVGPDGLRTLSIFPTSGPARQALEHAEPRMARALAALAARCFRSFHDEDDVAELCMEASALELVAALLRSTCRPAPSATAARRPRWLADIRAYLERHFHDPLSLAALARLAGVHPVHLVRAFRRHEGLPPGAFVRRLRLEAARRALAGSDRPIADIALEVGFTSQSHLTRLFRRALGVTPAAYRRAERGAERPARADFTA